MSNHLIIGLGGTGGKVIRELRKRVYEEFHSNEPVNNVNLEYLYVDSSLSDLNDCTDWKVMSKLNSDDVNLMTSQLEPLVTAGVSGQCRRLGRILFANNLSVRDSNADFVSCIRLAVSRLTTGTDSAVTFHICAGLAGGTGSGSVIDAISQIRKEFASQPGGDHYKIQLYLYVPEVNVVTASHDAGFYQANGYAALLELNAMSVGRYMPYNVTGKKDNFTGEVQRLFGGINAFEVAYIYTNVNEAGKVLDIAKGLPASVADFMFQKIVVSKMLGKTGEELNRVEEIVACEIPAETERMNRLVDCENDGAGLEYDRANQPARSRKFMSFGIKRVEYPETEIEEFVTYNFACQAVRQLQFNLWQEGLGYGECSIDEVGSDYVAQIKDRKNRERLMLSNAYLMLAKAIIETPATNRWHDLEGTWEECTRIFADDVQINAGKKSWLALFSDACTDYYENNFRSYGVKKFYEIQRIEQVAYAKYIRRHIERILFNEWSSGQKSILGIEKYIRLLMADCQDRIAIFKNQTGKLEEELDYIHGNVHKINVEWDNIGLLRDIFTGASKKAFMAYKTAKCEFYTTQTCIEAYRYAAELLQRIIEELGSMVDGIVAYKCILTEILKEMGRQADSRCKKEALGEETLVMKKYDPDRVYRFTKSCISNKEIQRSNAQSIRNQLVALLGDENERSFSNLCEKNDYETITGILLDVCQQNALAAMEDSAKADPLNKMVGVNILERLKQECNSEGQLENFVCQLVTSVMTYVQFDSEEQGKVFGNNSYNVVKMIELCLPKYEEDKSGFCDRLIQAFKQVASEFYPKQVVTENYKNNQIVVVAATCGFPLRHIANVKVLKQRYENLLAATDKELNAMVLHTERFAKPLPSIIPG